MENLLVRNSIFQKWYCEQNFWLTIWTTHAAEKKQIDAMRSPMEKKM